LMEINPRLSASVEVAVRAGVPFPRLLYDWAAGERLTEIRGYRIGTRMRWFGGDVAWLRTALADSGHPDVPSRPAAIGAFFAGFGLRTGYDYLDRHDPRPALRAARIGARRIGRRTAGGHLGKGGGGTAPDTDVAVIGAGPYGLSISAHLSAQKTSHEIFGAPMDTWCNHMPPGMFLKSEGFASNLSEPAGEHTLERFCAESGRDYGRIAVPIRLDAYVRYGCWFQERVVPRLDRRLVQSVTRSRHGFELTLEGGERLGARKVIVATGVYGQSYIPPGLGRLPSGALTHTFDRFDPAGDGNDRALVIGAGQSALEAAVLISEKGGSATVVARTPRLKWNSRPGGIERPLRQRWRRPESGLGEGRRQWASANHPLFFHAAPRGWRTDKAFAILGPAGAWWLRPRFEGRVKALLQRTIDSASYEEGLVELQCQGPDGDERLIGRRVIAGTGYRPRLDRLAFLDPRMLAAVTTLAGAPLLDTSFETSVPGLLFAGFLAAPSFGPLMRFVYGADFTARRLARHLARIE